MDLKIEKIKKIEHLGVTEGLDLVSVFFPLKNSIVPLFILDVPRSPDSCLLKKQPTHSYSNSNFHQGYAQPLLHYHHIFADNVFCRKSDLPTL